MAADLTDARRWTRDGTTLFLAEADLDEAALGAPSALPGWTRRHLLAHVAANAEALGNLVHWAATGEPTPMYSSPGDRAAGIERGALLPDAELGAWLRAAAQALDDAMTKLSAGQWQAPVLTAQGRTVPATEVPWLRAREVYVHAVDLATGLSFAELPAGFCAALCDDVIAKRRSAPGPALVFAAADTGGRWELPGTGRRRHGHAVRPAGRDHRVPDRAARTSSPPPAGSRRPSWGRGYEKPGRDRRRRRHRRPVRRARAGPPGPAGRACWNAPGSSARSARASRSRRTAPGILHEYGLLDEATALGVLPDSMVMRDALDGSELTRLDLKDLRAPVRLPLHGHPPQRPARHVPARLRPGAAWTCSPASRDVLREHARRRPGRPRRRQQPGGADVVIAADGLHSVARAAARRRRAGQLRLRRLPGRACRSTKVRENDIARTDVVVYVGPRCHFVQYPLRGGEMLNQVAVFESPKARDGERGLGHP